MNKEQMDKTAEGLSKLLVNPPTKEGAMEMCEQMEKVYVSAIAGLFITSISTQKVLDRSYALVPDICTNLKDLLHEVLYCIALDHDLEPQGMSDTNMKAYYDILKEIKDEH